MNSDLLQNLRQLGSRTEPKLLFNPMTQDSIVNELSRNLVYLYGGNSQSRNEPQIDGNWLDK